MNQKAFQCKPVIVEISYLLCTVPKGVMMLENYAILLSDIVAFGDDFNEIEKAS